MPADPFRRAAPWDVAVLALLACMLVVCGPPQPNPALPADWESQRAWMVETQIEKRGIENPRVLAAMRTIPRHLFVPERYRRFAYRDAALPIGMGQTISQPYLVALMTELLDPRADHKVLEIGTGSGYHAAVVSRLVETVYTIEIIPELAERARAVLAAGGYENVVVIRGDGYRGLPEEAPFDGILVTAAPEKVPETLLQQLDLGGRLVIPVGARYQELKVLERTEEGVRTKSVLPVRFVPMVRP